MVEIRLRVDNLLSFPKAAEFLGVARQTIYALVQKGELHTIDISGSRYILIEELQNLKAKRERQSIPTYPAAKEAQNA